MDMYCAKGGNHRQELKWETETAMHREKRAAG